MFPSSRKDAFESLLIGAVTHPFLFLSALVVAVATPAFLRPLEDRILGEDDKTTYSAQHHIVLLSSCALVGVALIALLLWLRRRKPGLGKNGKPLLQPLFPTHKSMSPPPAATNSQILFILWQILFTVALSLTFLVFDFAMFPHHARHLQLHDYEGIGFILQHPVITVWSYLRPLSMTAVTMVWLMLLGWWSDAREKSYLLAEKPIID